MGILIELLSPSEQSRTLQLALSACTGPMTISLESYLVGQVQDPLLRMWVLVHILKRNKLFGQVFSPGVGVVRSVNTAPSACPEQRQVRGFRHANKSACSSFVGAGTRYGTSESETKT